MMIHGLSFLSLSASVVLPWALTGLVQGHKITDSLIRDVRQSFSVPEKKLPNRKLIAQAARTTYYVSGTGRDTYNGLSPQRPFRTVQRAADLTNPGDTVLVMNGLYTNSHPLGAVAVITRSGVQNAWITYKAYPGHSPKLKFNGWQGFWIREASYIEVNGFDIEGNNRNIDLNYAEIQKNNTTPLTSGGCILIDGKFNRNKRPHHIRILNNKLHDAGGGVGANESDYLTFSNNEVFNNAWYSPNGSSGISILKSWNYDNNKNYKIFITNNRVYNNRMYIPWKVTGKIQDGNGIIIDRSRNDEVGSTLPPYQGRALIANNVVYRNGGGGIHTFKSDQIDIVHNISYQNNQSPEISSGQISINVGDDVKVLNNILYSEPGKQINGNSSRNTKTTFNYNLYNNNGGVAQGRGANDIIADPQFVNALGRDFRVKTTSPAINSGLRFPNITTDFLGNPRVRGSGPDRGAYEIR